jgi:16S rRNA (adenine1518-N6/adenine1519-N6)-dimethyltransferase
MTVAKKTLGQHWLNDEPTLSYIAKTAVVDPRDTILEIGPGQGSLTKHLLKRAKKVVAVEKDVELAKYLSSIESWKQKLEVFPGDILKFDLALLPKNYKVVANIPYYLTGHLLKKLASAQNPPQSMTLLLQKEVAQRIAAQPGKMSVIAVSVQLKYDVRLGKVVPAELFSPPPKVDSQVVILKSRGQPMFFDLDEKKFFQVVKAGFSAPRKMLHSNLAGGLAIGKTGANDLLAAAEVNGSLRAEALSMEQWHRLYIQYRATADLRSLL